MAFSSCVLPPPPLLWQQSWHVHKYLGFPPTILFSFLFSPPPKRYFLIKHTQTNTNKHIQIINIMFRSLIPRLPSSSLAHLPVNASSDALKAARLEKLTVMRQIAPIQHHRQAGTTAPTDVADAAKRLAALRITERRRRVAAHIDKRPATVKFTSSESTSQASSHASFLLLYLLLIILQHCHVMQGLPDLSAIPCPLEFGFGCC